MNTMFWMCESKRERERVQDEDDVTCVKMLLGQEQLELCTACAAQASRLGSSQLGMTRCVYVDVTSSYLVNLFI